MAIKRVNQYFRLNKDNEYTKEIFINKEEQQEIQYSIPIIIYNDITEREKEKLIQPILEKNSIILNRIKEENEIPDMSDIENMPEEYIKDLNIEAQKRSDIREKCNKFLSVQERYSRIVDPKALSSKSDREYFLYFHRDFLKENDLDFSFILDPVVIKGESVITLVSSIDTDNMYEIYKEMLDKYGLEYIDC